MNIKTHLSSFFLYVLVFSIFSQCWIAREAWGKDFVILRSSEAVTVDGKLNEKSWSDAQWQDLVSQDGSTKPHVATKIAFTFDTENLYVAVRADEPHPEKINLPEIKKLKGNNLWKGDVIEWFIQLEAEGPYVQLAWNPADNKVQGRFESPGSPDESRDLTWETKTLVGEKGWISEASIHFSALGIEPPQEGDVWYLNLIRQRLIEGTEMSAFSPPGASHHDPERFGRVWFEKKKEVSSTSTLLGEDTVRVLVGCFDASVGYDVLLNVRTQLGRLLSPENLTIRTMLLSSGSDLSFKKWPRDLEDLQQYAFIVLTGIPCAAFTPEQVKNLRRYVEAGGHILMAGPLMEQNDISWEKSALGEYIPDTSEVPISKIERKRFPIVIDQKESVLFSSYPEDLSLTIRATKATLKPGAISLAHFTGPDKDHPWTFISEKNGGKGSVMRLNAAYAQSSTVAPTDEVLRKDDFCRSDFYPIFWKNLVKYWTGVSVEDSEATKDATMIKSSNSSSSPITSELNILRNNNGSIFTPGGTILLKSLVQGEEDRSYEVVFSIHAQTGESLSLGKYTVSSAQNEIKLPLPDLDAGIYILEGIFQKEGREIRRVQEEFVVAFPPSEKDEFTIGVVIDPAFEKEDIERISHDLKSSGFNMATYLGGIVADSYAGQYRSYQEILFNSWMQRGGMQTWPDWDPLLYCLLMPVLEGSYSYLDHDPKLPDWAFPGKDFLPWQSYWLDRFERRLGHLPLTTGVVIGDEITSTMLIINPSLLEGFTKMTGESPPSTSDIERNSNLAFVEYRNKAMNDAAWLTRKSIEAFRPSWRSASVITPNCFAGHSTCLIDIPGQASTISAVSTDIYRYGEPKFYQKNLHSLALIWSGSDFGKLAHVGLCAGNLVSNYYMDYPEQMFAGLSAGIQWLEVFNFKWAGFEQNGEQNKKLAEIATRTNREGERIGRMLRHYERERARAAVFYPHTAHLWLSSGKELNKDYLEMTGTSSQYLDLRFAFDTAFDIGRRMFGHLDTLFDAQIQRGELKNYDVLIVSYSEQMSEATLRTIKRFVERGGTLLISSDSGRLNEFNKPTDILTQILPATFGEERSAPADYSETRMRNKEVWSRGHVLKPKQDGEVLFNFSDGSPACVRGQMGRGEVIVLGMPLAALKGKSGEDRYALVEYLLNQKASLISKPEDGEFSAITFRSKRDHQRVFMVVNHNKMEAESEVIAEGDESENGSTLVDVVTGERLPFEVKEGILRFRVKIADRWGRALALLKDPPTKVEVSTASPQIHSGESFWLLVRFLRKDGLLVDATLPFDLEVTDPSGEVREDLSGVRIVENGIWTFYKKWPIAAKPGKWKAKITDPISGTSDLVEWEVH